MSAKKGNPFFVKVGGRFYHRDVIFPSKPVSAPGDDIDEEFVERDFLAEHGSYMQSPLEAKTGEPECFALDAYVQEDCLWDERMDRYLDDVDLIGDPLEVMITAEEAERDAYPDFLAEDHFFEASDENSDDDVIPIAQCSCERLPMFDRNLHDWEINKYHRRIHRGSLESHVQKFGKHDHTTIRGAIVDLEYSIDYPFSQRSILVAKPRVQR